MIFQLFRSYFL